MLAHCTLYRPLFFQHKQMSQRCSAVSEELHSSTAVLGWALPHSAPVYLTKRFKSAQLEVPEQLVLCYPSVLAMIISVQIASMYFITPNTEPTSSCFILK